MDRRVDVDGTMVGEAIQWSCKVQVRILCNQFSDIFTFDYTCK